MIIVVDLVEWVCDIDFNCVEWVKECVECVLEKV